MNRPVALLPLDERPVNTALPAAVAEIAGLEIALPPSSLLPRMRTAGDIEALRAWLEESAASSSAVVASIDMLAYGGLIASRISDAPIASARVGLEVLRRIVEEHPGMRTMAVATITRASRSYSPAEEPLYWAHHGVELHDLGAAWHRRFVDEPAGPEIDVPEDVRLDFARRRLRNHLIDLEALAMAERGVIDHLVLTADDTAPRSAGSLEQRWLDHWLHSTAATNRILMYPGADEVAATLIARLAADDVGGSIAIGVDVPDVDGARRAAPYENVAVIDSATRQLVAAGAVPAGPDESDNVLLVHAPSPNPNEWVTDIAATTPEHRASVRGFIERLKHHLDRGRSVGVADTRVPNGADRLLVETMASEGLLTEIDAYAGWNTAGNSLGTVVSAQVSAVAGRRRGLDPRAVAHEFRDLRIVEDYGFQAVVRTALLAADDDFVAHLSVPFDNEADPARFLRAVTQELPSAVGRVGIHRTIDSVTLPWGRTFEIGLTLR